MFAKVFGGGIHGIEGNIVEVEVDISRGLPGFEIVGLPDASVRESRERVKSAIRNQGYGLPVSKITVNLAPAHMRKEGPSYDLSIAVGILAAQGLINNSNINNCLILGELSLDGKVKGINGLIPIVLEAITAKKFQWVILPNENISEGAILKDSIGFCGVDCLKDVIKILNGEKIHTNVIKTSRISDDNSIFTIDFSEVKGQWFSKKALEIAASGGHNVGLIGPPGSGKTMLAHRIPTILPPLNFEERLEITKIYSAAGLLNSKNPIITKPPFRAPHHSISLAGLVGGGKNPTPGEISLSHLGVLFLDEFLEFKRDAIESLRQPLESGTITISRARGSYTFPARLQLITSFNPCPCGYLSHKEKECSCSSSQIQRYFSKMSGPIFDRLDLFVEVPPVEYQHLSGQYPTESSNDIRKRVVKARKIQNERYKNEEFKINSQLTPEGITRYCNITKDGKSLLESAFNKLNLSARGYYSILRVAKTIADLEGMETINSSHISTAVGYRSFDRQYWYNY